MTLHSKNRLPSNYDCARLETHSLYPYFNLDIWQIYENREKSAIFFEPSAFEASLINQ